MISGRNSVGTVSGLVVWIGFLVVIAACSQGEDAASSPAGQARCLDLQGSEPVAVTGGSFTMGTDEGYADEAPARQVTVGSFRIDRHEVTNRQFSKFVEETGYVTLAERQPDPADYPGIPADQLVPGSAVFTPDLVENFGQWWSFVEGASWRHPTGPDSSVDDLMDHPAVHLAHEDAAAYADWAGGRLPTAAEWEYAARGGLDGARYEWGEEPPHEGAPKANTWQGVFPAQNSASDGHAGLAPVGCYPPNGYGLHDMTGNVWEWVADEVSADGRLGTVKGGSYLCAPNYCRRYRPAARHDQETDFSASHIGFRVVYDAAE
ncbi:formylglycine-generating enzyme family protein [Aquisalinus flavus]|uniref:Sulfatase-modifying factor 1 n=1 Tax=Aquisalinus flavus TaxID=1526572 RepID=A0A8J2V1S4_9PROT|nr:formylglycine-generating enzyme family protein [Aquisalinus flavus]MBD0426011.1 formylglycine-generating enzyme family protein [Aquisalinus flavus]UNE48397.1 formylglycine-generating enzyme family protein [Aquisalinus flavus]GGD11441.1 sulfatase-modifying factor 1 [Aquisalinus flavus]